MMTYTKDRVILDKVARKLLRLPRHILKRLHKWVLEVEMLGLEIVRRIPGYHDEPLKGKRRKQRSVRLSRKYRVIYEIKGGIEIRIIEVKEVTKHEY